MTTLNNNHKMSVLKNTAVVALGGLLFGYDTGGIGGSQRDGTE